jgi:ABC-type Mn2+/Zn2+ transport system ATPase subunit
MITARILHRQAQNRMTGTAPRVHGLPMLEVSDLVKRYGDVLALDGCSLRVPAGHLVGLLGPNGAGKTTLMRTLFGLVLPDGGTVRWRGRPVDWRTWRRFGYMPPVGVLRQPYPADARRRKRRCGAGHLAWLPRPTSSQRREPGTGASGWHRRGRDRS